MKKNFIVLCLFSFSILISCQNASTSDENTQKKEAPKTIISHTSEYAWDSTQLVDLPNQPTVHVTSVEGRALVAMEDSKGKQVAAVVSMESAKVSVDKYYSLDLTDIKNGRPGKKLATHFTALKNRLIQNHIRATHWCRSTIVSESIRNDSYDNRSGAVLLKLKGAWSDPFVGFEVVVALSPDTGQFLDFTVTKPLLHSSVSFFSVPDSLILSGPTGRVVKEFSPWISACETMYNHIQKNHYKDNEQEKKDHDASELIDLNIRIGSLTSFFYENDEITLEELNNEEKK